ncbi:MAG: TolC family protein [Bacteroidetes bacterium]|nr:TolC family protein [Bacteroidota bacterium]
MDKKPVSLLILLGMVLFSINIAAQELWSLERCINYAFENNLQIKQSILDANSSDLDLKQSKLNMVPSLNSRVSQNYNWGRNPDPQTNLYTTEQTQQFYANVNSEVTLFDGLQQVNNVRQKQFDYLAKKYDSDKIMNDISLNIAASYLLILFNIELVNNAQRQVDISKQQIERTEKQVEAGAVAKGSLYDIQAQGAGEEANLVNAKNNLMLAYLDLMQLLDLEASQEFDIEKPQFEINSAPSLLSPDIIFSKAVDIMPEIKSAEYSVMSAERSLAIAKGMRSPRLYASGQYGSTFSDQIYNFSEGPGGEIIKGDVKPFSDQFVDNRYGSLFFGLQIPIFNGYQVSTNIKKSKIYKEAVDLNLQIEKNKLRKDIESSYADAIAAYQTYIARKKSVEAFTEAFKYIEEKFDVGMVNSTDYNVAKIQLNNAESDLASAKYDYIFKTKILDFYLGKSLTLSDIASLQE